MIVNSKQCLQMILKSMGVECKKDDMDGYAGEVDEEATGKFTFLQFCQVGFFLHFFFQVDFNQHILTFLQFLSQSSIFSERMLQISIFQLSVPSMAVKVHKFCITTFPIIFGGGSKSIWMSYTTFSLSGSVAKSRNVTQLHSRGRFC